MTTTGKSRAWKKARRSQDNQACVLVAPDGDDMLVSDSKYGTEGGPILRLGRGDWAVFLDDVRHGRTGTTGAVGITTVPLTATYPDGRTERTTWHLQQLPNGIALHYTDAEWNAFRLGVLDDEFTIPAVA